MDSPLDLALFARRCIPCRTIQRSSVNRQVILVLKPEIATRKQRYHMLGIEPYIIGALRDRDHGIILDLGIGLGFWGFITRTYATMESGGNPVIVGVDSAESIVRMHKGMKVYSELVRGDIKRLPFKGGSFDTVIAIESFFTYGSQETVSAVESLAKDDGLVVLSGFFEKSHIKRLLERGYEIYRVGLWGLMLENIRNGKRTYLDQGLRRFSILVRFLARYLHPGQEDYVIALRQPKTERIG